MENKMKSQLMNQYPDLVESIISGAIEAIEERLNPIHPMIVADEWDDGNINKTWKGPHVEELCKKIAAEIKKKCAEINNLKQNTYQIGDQVKNRSGGSWRGTIVGCYQTSLNPEGYIVESAFEPGSVQLYPVYALDSWNGDHE